MFRINVLVLNKVASSFWYRYYNEYSLQILKYEWPKNWPTFMGDIVGASKTNESLCQNNMIILKLLRSVYFYGINYQNLETVDSSYYAILKMFNP